MKPRYPEFVPDPTDSREGMEALQREIAERALFADDLGFDPRAVSLRTDESLLDRDASSVEDAGSGVETGPENETDRRSERRSGREIDRDPRGDGIEDRPLVAGVDQAFLDDQAVSAIVCLRGGTVIERASAVSPLEFPYVPGLLSFREGGSILATFAELETEPDLVCFDGSGRVHFREAGLATHVGLALDVPAIGVAKSLLCGTPRENLTDRPAGTTVAIEADGECSAPTGTVIGYAVQTKQYEGARYVNPLYVSSGHRVSAKTAADLTLALTGEYKLPEPTRQADAYAAELKGDIE